MKMQKPLSRVRALSSLLLAALAFISALHASPRPNVVIIYGDDVGFGDIGVNGSKLIPTPNIDRLASGGINFTDAHSSASTCSPSRFSMLSGLLAHRRNVNILGPTSPMPITPEDYTLPKLFQDAGYATAVIGKWHLGLGAKGNPIDWNQAIKPGPLEIGFDYAFLIPNTNDRVPCVYTENHHVVNLDPNDPISLGEKTDPRSTEYPTASENPEAMTYYRNTHGHGGSVIAGISRIGVMYGGKSALWDDANMADELVKRTDRWMDKHMETNKEKPFFLYYAAHNIHVPRLPHPRFRGATSLGYRGDSMVEFDWAVGQLLAMLDKHGIADNTIVIFSSDNGPVYDDGYDDGTTVKKSEEEVDRGHDGSGLYRGGKYQIHEGGNRVPMILRWPDRIQPKTTGAMVSHLDFMASFADLLDVELPAGAAYDSQNVLAALLGEPRKDGAYLIQEGYGYALRHGDWKLVMSKNNRKDPEPLVALYNLAEDIGETTDIKDQYPERFEKMKRILQRIEVGTSVPEAIQ